VEVFFEAGQLPLAQFAAFWASLLCFRGDHPGRFLFGLAAGGVLARLGWILLHLPALTAEPGWNLPLGQASGAEFLAGWLGPGAGFSVLLVPLGPLALAPWSQGSVARTLYWAAACRALAPGLAVARAGCVWAGWCSGPEVPTALYEALGWLLASGGLALCSPARVPGLFGLVFGGLRLATEPWRATPPLGEPLLDPGWVALAWALAGAWALWGGSGVGTLLSRPGAGSGPLAAEASAFRGPSRE